MNHLAAAKSMFSDNTILAAAPVPAYENVLSPSVESNVRPAPAISPSAPAPLARIMFLSAITTSVEFTVVVVPSTLRSPKTRTIPSA